MKSPIEMGASTDIAKPRMPDNFPMGAVNRTVTVMFTDVVGSTALSERLGPVAARALFETHFAALRNALSIHRGSEVKALGDGMMAVFDSVIDALAAAVTMQRAVARQNRTDPDHALAMRVGISVGEAVGDRGDWNGRPVVEAARLCDVAGSDGITVSDFVRQMAANTGMHRFLPMGPLELKGLGEPVHAWSVDWDVTEEFALRVAIAEDSALLRQGIASALASAGIDVVLEASDGDAILRGLEHTRPHVAVLDMRMPPTHSNEGLWTAERIRAERPEIGVLVLSATVDAGTARRLLSQCTHGVGYLLKDRIMDIGELTTAIRTVASGGSAIDPEILALLS